MIALAVATVLSACGAQSGEVRPSSGARPGGEGSYPPPVPTLPAATDGVRVLYDDAWTVEEGQWWLGSAAAYFDGGDIPSYRQILESVNAGSVSITVPGADGRYRARVELRDVAPPVAGWCGDVAEASLEVPAGGDHAVTMGSFETFADLPVQRAGWYRVRYCTEEQDRAAAEDAHVRNGLVTYTGRHLIQLWPERRAPDRVLRERSTWARRLSSGRSG